MSFEFELDTSDVEQSSGGGGSKVDYDALHLHTIEAAGTQNRAKTIVGYITGLYDLGLQPRNPYEKVYDSSNEEDAKAVESGNAKVELRSKYYDDGKWLENVEVYSAPQKSAKAVALAVDFPGIMVDKSQFYGKSDPKPLRLIMGKTWAVENPDKPEKKMLKIQSPFFLNENTGNPSGEYALGNRTTLFKMAEAADVLDEKGNFKASAVSKLLGKPLMFRIQVHMKQSKKKPNQSFYTEDIKFASEVPEGMPIPELDQSLLHGVNMNKSNAPEAVKQLRAEVKNTMRLSEGWDKSVIKQELEAANKSKPANDTPNTPAEEKKDSPAVSNDNNSFDDDIPF